MFDQGELHRVGSDGNPGRAMRPTSTVERHGAEPPSVNTASSQPLHRTALIVLMAISLAALVLRLYRLNEIPPGLFLDEAGNGMDVLEILSGRRSIFFERSLGKEPLFNYLIVPFVAWLGREPLALRLPAALAGTLAVPATFLLARELLWEEGEEKAAWAGLFAAGLLAASYWAVTFSRISFRASTLPVLAAIAFAAAWWTLRVGGKGKAVVTGLLLGLCFYTYLAGRFVYPLAVVGLALVMLSPAGRAQLRQRRQELALIVLVCFAVMLPLVAYFALHPEDFARRAGMVAFTATRAGGVTPLAVLQQSLTGNLGMFGGMGDLEPRHNLPGRSLLTPWLAIAFWAGLALALARGLRPKRLFAVAWFGLLLLPAILAAEPPRHALRAIGAQPIVYFLCALTIVEVAGWLASRWRLKRGAANSRSFAPAAAMGLLLAVLVTVETAITVQAYFGRWSQDPITYSAFLGNDRAVAEEINHAPPDVRYVVPLNDRWRELGGKYTLDFLVQRPQDTLFYFPKDQDAAARLSRFVSQPGLREVRLVRMTEGDDVSADPQETATLLLGQGAQPLPVQRGTGYYVEVFQPAQRESQELALPQPDQPSAARFANNAGQSLALVGWGVAPSAVTAGADISAGGLGAVALRWLVEQPPTEQLRVSLRLVDGLHQLVGQDDSTLVDTRPLYNPDWQAGDTATTYHPLRAAPGTPPGEYTLYASLYSADTQQRLAAVGAEDQPREWVRLGAVRVAEPLPGAPPPALLTALPQPVMLAPGLALLGYEAGATALPGLPLNLALVWEVTEPQDDHVLAVMLDGQTVGRVPLDALPRGQWRTVQQIMLPADVTAGDYALSVRREASHEQVYDSQLPAELGNLAVEPTPRLDHVLGAAFAGGITLQGWRVDPQQDGTQVTLFWQTDGPLDQDLSVFVHVVDEAGRLIAQHDAAPDSGRFPATAWPAGVTIPDRHVLSVPGLGDAVRLRAGLYLPGSGVRLPLREGGDYVEWQAGGRPHD